VIGLLPIVLLGSTESAIEMRGKETGFRAGGGPE